MGGTVTAVLLGSDTADAPSLGAFGASEVILAQDAALNGYSTEGHTQAAAEIVVAEKPSFVLFAGTARGRDLAPRVAARLGCSLLSDCTDLKVEAGALHLRLRPFDPGEMVQRVENTLAVLARNKGWS
jgi:electron transfer flavoprotein alpha subunit